MRARSEPNTSKGTLVIISQVYVPDPASVGQHMHDAAKQMVRRGWHVVVFAAARGYEDPRIQYQSREMIDGVEVRRLPLASFGKTSIPIRLLGAASFLSQAILRTLRLGHIQRILVSTSPPMCSVAGVLVSRLRNAELKFWVMDINPDQTVALGKALPNSVAVRAFDALNRQILRHASDVIVLDRFMADRMQRKYPIREKTSVIPPWPHIDTAEPPLPHDKNPFRKQHGLQGKFVVMYSGNLSPAHPVTTMLEAAVQLRDEPRLLFMFIGGGGGKAEVEQYQHKYQLENIRILPYQPLSELRYSLSAADTHLVSIGESMVGVVHPCKVYGAMAVGRPVLALGPKKSHLAEIIETYDAGWHIEHGDVTEAVRLLRSLVEISAKEPGNDIENKADHAYQTVQQHFARAPLMSQFCDVLEAQR